MTWTHLPPALFWPYLFGVGACVGSFLGVVVARLPLELSIVRPRSRCDSCFAPLPWYDNIPLVSFLLLRGRCRACRVPLGARSLILELVTALVFMALGAHLGQTWQLAWWLVFASGLLAITFLDIDHFWVPDVITYPLMVWALLATAMPFGPALGSTLWGLLPAALLWGVAWVFERIAGKEGLGLGDIKLLAALGLMLGLPSKLTLLFLASLQGAVLGSIVLAFGGHAQQPMPVEASSAHPGEQSLEVADEAPWVPDPKAVPFGPFLVLAAFEVLFFPDVFTHIFGRLAGLS